MALRIGVSRNGNFCVCKICTISRKKISLQTFAHHLCMKRNIPYCSASHATSLAHICAKLFMQKSELHKIVFYLFIYFFYLYSYQNLQTVFSVFIYKKNIIHKKSIKVQVVEEEQNLYLYALKKLSPLIVSSPQEFSILSSVSYFRVGLTFFSRRAKIRHQPFY